MWRIVHPFFNSIPLRSALIDLLNFGMIVSTILMIWKGFMCINGSESPVVFVISGRMEPGFQGGDVLILQMSDDPIRSGAIVVFMLDGRDIPIVHRVIQVTITLRMTGFSTNLVSFGCRNII